jgi:hypothetical protein
VTRQSELNEFGQDLSDVQADTQLEWAAVENAAVMRREDAFTDVTPGDAGASDQGITVTYHLASGRTVEEWYEKPTEWDMVANDLVLLLEYWELDPGDIDQLDADDEVFEVPVEHDDSVGNFRPDWQAIERTIHTRELDAEDDV